MSPTSHSYNNPSTPSQFPDPSSVEYYDYNNHNQHPQFGVTPLSNAPKNMYPEAETFNDGMVAEVVSREHRSGYGQEHRTDRVKPDDLEDDDEFTDDDEDTDLEEKTPKYKSAPKQKTPAVTTPVPDSRPRPKKPLKDPITERKKQAENNAKEMDDVSGIKNHRRWNNEEHRYDSEDIEEFERQIENNIPPDGLAMDAHGKLVNKNGRVKGRKLVLWHRPRMIEKLVLHMQYELHRRGIEVPWNSIVHRLSPGSSGQSATQQLNKLRDALVSEGHLVPPLLGKVTQRQQPEIRGFLRDMNKEEITETRIVGWNEEVEDLKKSIVNPGVVRGSGNYRKNPTGKGLDKVVKASAKKIGLRRSRQPESEQPASSEKRTRKYEEVENEDLEEVVLEDLETPSKRQKSTRPTRTRAQPQAMYDSPTANSHMITLKLGSGALTRFPTGESRSRGAVQHEEEDLSPEIKRNPSSDESGSEYRDDTPSKKRGIGRRAGVASEPHHGARTMSSDLKASNAVRLIDFSAYQAPRPANQGQPSTKPRNNKSREASKQANQQFRNHAYAHYQAMQAAEANMNAGHGNMGTAPSGYASHYQDPQVHAQYGGNGHYMNYGVNSNVSHGHPYGMSYLQNGFGNMVSNDGLPSMTNVAPAMNMHYPASNSGYSRAIGSHPPNMGYRNVSGGNGLPASAPRIHTHQVSNISESSVRSRAPNQGSARLPNPGPSPARLSTNGPSPARLQGYQAREESQGQSDTQQQQRAGDVQSFQNVNNMSFESQNPIAAAQQAVYPSQENADTVQSANHPPYDNGNGAHSSHHSPYANVDTDHSAVNTPYETMNGSNIFNNEIPQCFEQGGNDEGHAGELLDDAEGNQDDSGNETKHNMSYHSGMSADNHGWGPSF